MKERKKNYTYSRLNQTSNKRLTKDNSFEMSSLFRTTIKQ